MCFQCWLDPSNLTDAVLPGRSEPVHRSAAAHSSVTGSGSGSDNNRSFKRVRWGEVLTELEKHSAALWVDPLLKDLLWRCLQPDARMWCGVADGPMLAVR